MTIQEAAAVLRQLLDGVDPDTGEVLPADNVLYSDSVRGALAFALQTMGGLCREHAEGGVPLTRSGRLHAGRPWTQQDLDELRTLYESGMPIPEIARMTQRRERGVRLQLNLMAGGGAGRHERVCIPDVIGGNPPIADDARANAYAPWTQQENMLLTQLHGEGWSIAEIARTLGRSRNAVSSRLKKLGLKDAPPSPQETPSPQEAAPPSPPGKLAAAVSPSRRWMAWEDEYLCQAWAEGVSVEDMCTRLKRRDRLVRCRLVYLNAASRSILGEPELPPEMAHQGLPWYPEEIDTLYRLFREGRTHEAIAAELKRSVGAVRSRLDMLSLTDAQE